MYLNENDAVYFFLTNNKTIYADGGPRQGCTTLFLAARSFAAKYKIMITMNYLADRLLFLAVPGGPDSLHMG
jgi:hypothetical protein